MGPENRIGSGSGPRASVPSARGGRPPERPLPPHAPSGSRRKERVPSVRSRLLLLALASLLGALPVRPVAVEAQERVRVTGQVREAETEDGLRGVRVQVEGTEIGTLAGNDGGFSLEVPPGEHRLVASAMGFEPDTVAVSVGAEGLRGVVIHLTARPIQLEEIRVRPEDVGGRVRELARARGERRQLLENYRATVHRLGFLYQADADSTEVIGFSERILELTFIPPRSYAERLVANRASGNFFSESEIFATRGGPLDLTRETVDLDILSGVVSLPGPISEGASEHYEIVQEPAGEGWPEGTTKISFTPKSSRRPLFDGHVFVDDETESVIGVDVRLNEAGNVSTGLFSVSGLHYVQEYEQVEQFWVPSRTEVEARVGVIGFGRDFVFRDRWIYENYRLNDPRVSKGDIPLSGVIVERGADDRDETYWKQTAGQYRTDRDEEELARARAYEEDRMVVNLAATTLRTYATLPSFLQNFYLSNISDFYRFNRVEGNYLGFGIRTPAAIRDLSYKGSVGIATKSEDLRYNVEGLQFIPGTPLAVEAGVYRRVAVQFSDYKFEEGPLNFSEFRHSMLAGIIGYDPRNFFERQGFRAGLRWRVRPGVFLRANYMKEDQEFLPVVTDNKSFFGETPSPNLNPDVGRTPPPHPGAEDRPGFTEGEFTGFEFQFRFDNRQFEQDGVVRDYTSVRKFGFYTDHFVHWSDPGFGAGEDEGFDFLKYRSTLGFRIPLLASHFLLPEITVGGATRSLPAQLQFANNGVYVEDFLRRRPFETLEFDEAVGNRVTVGRLTYDLGTSLVRHLPWGTLRESGVRLAVWSAVGYRHPEAEMEPVTPWTDGVEDHVEVGFSLTRVLGVLSLEMGIRVEGDAGESVEIRYPF